jgi:beta-lactamase class D
VYDLAQGQLPFNMKFSNKWRDVVYMQERRGENRLYAKSGWEWHRPQWVWCVGLLKDRYRQVVAFALNNWWKLVIVLLYVNNCL